MIWVCTFHDAYIKNVYSGYWIFYFLKKLWNNADSVIAVSDYVRLWAENNLLIPKEKIKVINHGIIFKNKIIKKQNNNNKLPIILGSLARFEERKGFKKLVKIIEITIKKIPNIELHLTGDNPFGYKEEIKLLIEKNNLSKNIFLHDFEKDINKFFNKIDIYLYASSAEGFGLSLVEALSFDLPIICFDIAPLNNIVKNNENGLLIKPFDLNAFSKSLIYLVKNKQAYINLSQNNSKEVKQKYSLEKMVFETDNLYQNHLL